LLDYQSGDYTAATQRFGMLASNGAFVDESLFYLGAMAERRESWEEALQLYQRVGSGDRAVAAQGRVARIKLQRESRDKALEHLQQFADSHPEFAVEMIASQAALQGSDNDESGALARLEEGLKKYPDAYELKFARGFLLEKMNRIREAVAQMRELVDTRPGDPAALNALGYTLVDRTRQYREGFDFVQSALQQTPDSGAVLDSFGWAQYRTGHSDEALKTLQRARERIQDPEVELHIAQVQASMKQTAQARDTVASAIQRYPDDTELKKYAERIKER
jgi:tetratricopeptide (TPR) repeat protein